MSVALPAATALLLLACTAPAVVHCAPRWSYANVMRQFGLVDTMQLRVVHRLNELHTLHTVMQPQFDAHMIEVDVVYDHDSNAVMIGHDVGGKYNVTLAEYIDAVLQYSPLRGLHLDFKETKAAEHGMQYLASLLQRGGLLGERLLADLPLLVVGPAAFPLGDLEPSIPAELFIELWRRYVPTAVLAVEPKFADDIALLFAAVVAGVDDVDAAPSLPASLAPLFTEWPKRALGVAAAAHAAAVRPAGAQYLVPPSIVLSMPAEVAPFAADAMAQLVRHIDAEIAHRVGSTSMSYFDGYTPLPLPELVLAAVANTRTKYGVPVFVNLFDCNQDARDKILAYAGIE